MATLNPIDVEVNVKFVPDFEDKVEQAIRESIYKIEVYREIANEFARRPFIKETIEYANWLIEEFSDE